MKGKVGTPCKDEFLRKTDNIKTTKEIRANKTKILKEIKIILNSKSNYNYIAKELEMHTIDVLQLLQEETLQFGTNISKAMTKHLMDRGVTVSEIAELYNCDEVKVLLTLNEINDNDYRNKIKEIGIALKIYKLLEKSKGFNFISSKLNIDKYKAFNIYNKYFHRYNNRVIDFKAVKELSTLNLTDKEIANFYNITDEDMKQVRAHIIYEDKTKNLRGNKDALSNLNKEDILDYAYKESTNNDFYSIRSENKKYK